MKYIAPALPTLIVILCLPLLLGKVAPNGYYGFRTAKTRSSPEIWYVANRVAAINFIVASAVGFVLAMTLIQRKVNATGGLLSSVVAASVLEGTAAVVSLVQSSRLQQWFRDLVTEGIKIGLRILGTIADEQPVEVNP